MCRAVFQGGSRACAYGLLQLRWAAPSGLRCNCLRAPFHARAKRTLGGAVPEMHSEVLRKWSDCMEPPRIFFQAAVVCLRDGQNRGFRMMVRMRPHPEA